MRSPNRRCNRGTMQCAYRTTGAVIEQACTLTEPPVRLSNRPVRSPNHRCGYRTGLCAHRTGGATTDAVRHRCRYRTGLYAHRTTGAVIEQAYALTEPAVRPPHNAVRSPNHRCGYRTGLAPVPSPNHRCGYRTGLCAHRTGGATAQACSITAPVVR